jgi:hypothetical protein
MGLIKEIVIGVLALLMGWLIMLFFTGGAITLGFAAFLVSIFPVLLKPLMIIGFIFGIVFIIGRASK